jgi:hypothetical protein
MASGDSKFKCSKELIPEPVWRPYLEHFEFFLGND